MSDSLCDIFRRHFRPLEPVATGVEPVLRKLHGLRAVLFDLYGTLWISGSGEVGTAAAPCDKAMAEALCAVGLPPAGPPAEAVDLLDAAIRACHARRRAEGIEFPEVHIADMWREVLAAMAAGGLVEPCRAATVNIERLVVEYEARVNPCWPMPGATECLDALRTKGLLLGIISNAQFYTPLLFPALLGRSAEECGFDPRLQFYSYRHGRAKPGTALFERAAEALCGRGLGPSEAIYVGNDMLNDIGPAARAGFRTALFAGDARSLRRRDGEPQLEGVVPDLVLTALAQLEGCIRMV